MSLIKGVIVSMLAATDISREDCWQKSQSAFVVDFCHQSKHIHCKHVNLPCTVALTETKCSSVGVVILLRVVCKLSWRSENNKTESAGLQNPHWWIDLPGRVSPGRLSYSSVVSAIQSSYFDANFYDIYVGNKNAQQRYRWARYRTSLIVHPCINTPVASE